MKGQEGQAFDAMMKPGIEAFNYWISFFPTAPLFGVEWRFGKGFDLTGVIPQPEAATKTNVTPLKRATKPAAEPVEKPSAKAKPAMKAKPAKAKPADVIPLTKTEAPAKPASKPAPKAAPEKPSAAAKKTAAPKAKKPAAEAKPAPAKAADGKPAGLLAEAPAKPDDLKLLKGIGPGLEKQLNGLGIYRFDQIAGFTDKDLSWIDDNLTAFKGRCFRDDWAGQAKAQLG